MNPMTRLYQFVSTAGICAVSGAIAGAIVGGLFGLVWFLANHPAVHHPQLLGTAIGLSLAAWLAVLVIVGGFGNYGVLAILGQSFVTCLVTGVLTVLLIYTTRAGLFGMLLGWVMGFLVGKAFCRLCDAPERNTA
jgi:hypothetical protein